MHTSAVLRDCVRRERAISWNERCTGPNALWNHCAHFGSVHTVIWDGYPLFVWKPKKWEDPNGVGARLLQSGKYNACCFKGHVAIGFNGLIHAHTLHVGVEHDQRMWDDGSVCFPMKPGPPFITGCECAATEYRFMLQLNIAVRCS